MNVTKSLHVINTKDETHIRDKALEKSFEVTTKITVVTRNWFCLFVCFVLLKAKRTYELRKYQRLQNYYLQLIIVKNIKLHVSQVHVFICLCETNTS